MKKQFVKTSNYRRFLDGITAAQATGAPEAKLLLVSGEAGRGKTAAIQHWAAHENAVFLRAKEHWTPSSFRRELCGEMRVDPNGHADAVFGRLQARFEFERTALVVDEAKHCLREEGRVMEAVRDLSDTTEIIVVLASEVDILSRIARRKELSSRIVDVIEFQPATVEDVRDAAAQLSEVPFSDELCAEIHRQSAGSMREIVKAVTVCETHGKRHRLKTVTPGDMAGKPLVYNWQARTRVRIAQDPAKLTRLEVLK